MHSILRATSILCVSFALLKGTAASRLLHAQSGYVDPETTITEALASLTARAGDIFTGQVVAIERKGGIVEISFAVDQALQGTASGIYKLHEWPGLWPLGQTRYLIGQRTLVFLRPASASGFSSPVDGTEGILPLLATTADGPTLVDVGRLSARLLRSVGQPLGGDNGSTLNLTDVVATIRTAQAATATALPTLPRAVGDHMIPSTPLDSPSAPNTPITHAPPAKHAPLTAAREEQRAQL